MLFIMLVGYPPFDSKGVKESIFTKVVMGDYKVSNTFCVYLLTIKYLICSYLVYSTIIDLHPSVNSSV